MSNPEIPGAKEHADLIKGPDENPCRQPTVYQSYEEWLRLRTSSDFFFDRWEHRFGDKYGGTT